MVNDGNSLSSIGVLLARIPALFHAGAASHSHVGAWRTQFRSWRLAGHHGHARARFVPPVSSPSGLPEILLHETPARDKAKIDSGLVRRSHVLRRAIGCNRVGWNVSDDRLVDGLRSLLHVEKQENVFALSLISSLTLCCMAPRSAWLRGQAAPCSIVREGSANMIMKWDMRPNLTNTDVPEVYGVHREGHDGFRPSLPTVNRIRSMLS